MQTLATLLSMTLCLATGPAPSSSPHPSPGESAPMPDETAPRMIYLPPLVTGRLDPGLAVVLPGLVAASLESGGGYQVTGTGEGAEWRLDLTLSGRGPWRISARAAPADAAVKGPRVATKKISFSGREDLTRAVEELTARLEEQWSASGRPAGAAAPVPLARALSPSTVAVDGYLGALAALRSTDASRATGLLDQALAADPSFVLAAAQRIRIHLASVEVDGARAVLAKMTPRPAAQSSPLSSEISGSLPILLRGPVGSLPEGDDRMLEKAPRNLWARTMRAIALSELGRHAEAMKEWRSIVDAQPDDVANRAFLGRSLMATGDFATAAAELERARKAWPSNLILYTLQAECLARVRDTEGARRVLVEMKDYAVAHDVTATSDALNPFLLIGSVDLLEGKFSAALKRFEEAAEMKSKSGEPIGPMGTLLQTIVEMRRDLVSSRDRLTRTRQIGDAEKALDRYEASLPPEQRASREMEIQRLRGLIMIKKDDTVGAWKLVDRMKAGAGQPGYSAYDEAYLSAAAALKEDDVEGGLAHFERAAKARGMLVDFMDLGEAQLALRRFDEARASFERIEKELERWVPAARAGLILADPHLAAMVPNYQYVRARLAYETGDGTESRRYFNHMLKYLRKPDEQFTAMVKEAIERGASPE
ncbi:MAG TPA: tetratricopeptide repeat protein [Candidatus Polarisedimenticolia bacterium]|jgi:tetratricopeptide (TPR) repeat protein